MENKEYTVEDRIIDFLTFAANAVTLIINIACAIYRLSRKTQTKGHNRE